MLRFRDFGVFVFDLGCFVFDLGVFVFEFWVLLFSRFGCFVLRSLFSSALFSKLPGFKVGSIDIGRVGDFLAFGGIGVVG